VTVGTDHIALLDLVEDALPVAGGKGMADIERLLSEVVELEHDRIGLAAFGAGMAAEVLD
jgi:hypothetical protein